MVRRGAYGTVNGFNLGVSFTPDPNANVTLTVGGDVFRAWGSSQPVSETFMIPAASWVELESTAVLGYLSFTLNGQSVSYTGFDGGTPTVYHYRIYTTGFTPTTGPGITEDPCQRETYTYDTAPNGKGRLASVIYKGGYNAGSSPTCDTTFTELYEYSVPGAITKKTLRIKRGSLNDLDMVSTYSYNSEGQLTGMTYPSSWNGSTWSPGPSRSVQYDLMGRPKKLVNAATSADVVTTTTYGVMGQILTMNGPGMDSETREYNSIGQMTRLVAGWQDVHYNYPSTGNNGKVTSEDRKWSSEPTETVTYTYDSLNRLASAVSSDNPGWGQSFGYDGFGNLTNVSVTKGSAPSLSVSYNASTNRRTSDCADANGNISPCGQTYTWDVSNRLTSVPVSGGTMRYSYDTANRRIWRGSSSVDELTYYAASGSKMVVYNLSTSGSDLRATSTETHEYFNGRKLGGAADRLGSYGRYYPYGQDRPANPSNPGGNTEKFATYRRDGETGLDYAVNRYHAPGDGRFLSPDPYQPSAGPEDPGSWNRYAYVGGDPVNFNDPAGLLACPAGTIELGERCIPDPSPNPGIYHGYCDPNTNYNPADCVACPGIFENGQCLPPGGITEVFKPASQLSLSMNGLNCIKGFEAFAKKPYKVGGIGNWTIGYGHEIRDGETFDDTFDEKQALDLLAKDTAWADDAVSRLVKVSLTQYQFDALVSLVFNIGPGRAARNGQRGTGLAGSELLAKINAGLPVTEADFMATSSRSNAVYPGLPKRRKAEFSLFSTGQAECHY